MKDALKQTDEDIQKWSRLIYDSHELNNVLYVGGSDASVILEFAQLGVSAFGCQVDELSGPGKIIGPDGRALAGQAGLTLDTLVFQNEAVQTFINVSHDAFRKQFGDPERIFVIFSLAKGEPFLPAVSKWLWEFGFQRDLTVELWVDDRILICLYQPGKLAVGSVLEHYEAECWRLSQLNQKRRLLLREYHVETVELNFLINDRIEGLQAKIQELELRWESFQNSRTGKAIKQMQKIRQRILPGRKPGESH